MPQQPNKTNMSPFRIPPVNLILRPSFTYFFQHSLIRNLGVIRPLDLSPNSIKRALNRIFRRCVDHFTLYRRCIGRPSAINTITKEIVRVETDLVSLAFVAFSEFEIINRITAVIFRKFLTSAPRNTSTSWKTTGGVHSRKCHNRHPWRICSRRSLSSCR